MKEHDNKTRTAVWLSPSVIRRMDGWLEEDNCKSRSTVWSAKQLETINGSVAVTVLDRADHFHVPGLACLS